MGSQQLLLIVLGIIVVGLMIFAGATMMRSYSESSNREQIIANMYDLGILAEAYFKKTAAAGGGGGSFIGWEIPSQLKNTSAGTFEQSVNDKSVDISCNGKYIGRNETTVVRVTAHIDSDGIRITVIN